MRLYGIIAGFGLLGMSVFGQGDKPKPAPRTSGQVQFPQSCCKPRPCFVADFTYTAKKGDKSATVTRQARSELSYEHARALARILPPAPAGDQGTDR